MAIQTAFKLVDCPLKNICGNQRLFGGKCVIPAVPDSDQFTINFILLAVQTSILLVF